MKQADIDQLKIEIDHIFESGANQIRVFEMVVNFIDSRNLISAQFNSSIPYYFINIEENDIKALRRIRNYFGTSDKTQLEHLAYDVLNRLLKPFNESDYINDEKINP